MDGPKSVESPAQASFNQDPNTERKLLDIAAQQEFIGVIDKFRPNTITKLPDLSEHLDQETRRTTGLDTLLDGKGDRVFLAPGFFEYLEDNRMPNRLSFKPKPLLRMGKEDSAHQVFFGNIRAWWFQEATQQNMQVAIKPIPDTDMGREHLFQEASIYQLLAKLDIPTLEVFGVAMLEKPRHNISGFVITHFNPEIITLDSLPWGHMQEEERWEYVDLAIDTLAILHSELLFHGDPAFKNIALGEAKQSFTVVDLEWGTCGRGIADNVHRIQQMMANDLSVLTQSIEDRVIKYLPIDQKPQDDIEKFNILRDKVYEQYFERLVHIDSPYLDVLTKAYEMMIEKKAQMARGE